MFRGSNVYHTYMTIPFLAFCPQAKRGLDNLAFAKPHQKDIEELCEVASVGFTLITGSAVQSAAGRSFELLLGNTLNPKLSKEKT